MPYSMGKNLILTCYGASHAECIGGIIEGLPEGIRLDFDRIKAFTDRRRPGMNAFSTGRREGDEAVVLSGITESGVTNGTPLRFEISNSDKKSADYGDKLTVPRPMHADFPAFMRYGSEFDHRGGGQFSGRMTAVICFAGAIALQILGERGITIGAHALSVGGVFDERIDTMSITADELKAVISKQYPVINSDAEEKMLSRIALAKSEGDSVGGRIECCVLGLPIGLGEPIYDTFEGRLSLNLFSIPAVKGVEFGAGFACADMRGSEHNDPFAVRDGRIVTLKNDHGGILGGLTTGMPVNFCVAVKPTPSISREQHSVNLDEMKNVTLTVGGRHDPCIVFRAVPCVEAVAALTILDFFADIGE